MAVDSYRKGRVCCSKKRLVELILILFPETVTSREELPATLLVHLPYVRLL